VFIDLHKFMGLLDSLKKLFGGGAKDEAVEDQAMTDEAPAEEAAPQEEKQEGGM